MAGRHIERKFTREDLDSRGQIGDTLVIINDDVYDLTYFLNEHPGGDNVLLKYAGYDASEAFIRAGHSDEAKDLMVKFRVGEVEYEDFDPLSWQVVKPSSSSSSSSWQSWVVPVVLGVPITALFAYLFGPI